nr:MAG TPA: hypothetical protein [Caudoviricetes sp.]
MSFIIVSGCLGVGYAFYFIVYITILFKILFLKIYIYFKLRLFRNSK